MWHNPTAEEVKLARHLAEDMVARCKAEVEELIANGAIADSNRAPRLKLRRLQCMLGAVLMGLEDVLPALDINPDVVTYTCSTVPANSVALCDVPVPGWEGCSILADVTKISLMIAQHTGAFATSDSVSKIKSNVF